MIVHPPTERVLLRWHARQHAWLQVGGHGDPGEIDPLLIALREGGEETGLDDLVGWPDDRIVHVAVVPVPAARHEPAHEHADVRFVLATQRPDTARPENPTAALRWMTIPEARATTDEPNVRETLARLEHLFNAHFVARVGSRSGRRHRRRTKPQAARNGASMSHLPVGPVHHLRMTVTDVERSKAFYTERARVRGRRRRRLRRPATTPTTRSSTHCKAA